MAKISNFQNISKIANIFGLGWKKNRRSGAIHIILMYLQAKNGQNSLSGLGCRGITDCGCSSYNSSLSVVEDYK